MDVYEVNPYIRYTSISGMVANFKLNRRIIYDYELIYLYHGTWTLNYAGKDYICQPDQFIFIRPGVPHSISVGKEEVSQPHVHFDLAYSFDSEKVPISFKNREHFSQKELNMIRPDIFESYPLDPFVFFKNHDEILKCFFDVVSVSSNEPSDYLYQKAAMTRIISALIADNFPDCFSSPQKHGIERQIKDYIDAGQGMFDDLTHFEKQFSYDKFYLEKRFKTAYGVSIISYRNRKKMELARKLLESESVSSVAEKTGFSSIFSFSRAFKLHFGYPPSDIKK